MAKKKAATVKRGVRGKPNLTASQVDSIRKEYLAAATTMRELGEKYGVSTSAVYKALAYDRPGTKTKTVTTEDRDKVLAKRAKTRYVFTKEQAVLYKKLKKDGATLSEIAEQLGMTQAKLAARVKKLQAA